MNDLNQPDINEIDNHFKLVPNTAIEPKKKEILPDLYSTEYKSNFSKASNDFWFRDNEKTFKAHKLGYILGTSKNGKVDFSDVLNRLVNTIEEILREEFKQKNRPTELIKTYMDVLKASVGLIISQTIQVDQKTLISAVHGCINSYIDSIVNENKM